MKNRNKIKKCFSGIFAMVVAMTSIPLSYSMGIVEASSIEFGEVAFSFGVVSDLHLHQATNESSAGVQTKVQRYANTVATLNELAQKNSATNGGLDALLLSGDYMDVGNAQEAKTFAAATREILDALDAKNTKDTKFIMTYGNHETEAGGSAAHMSYAEWESLLQNYNLLDEDIVYGSETDKTEGAYKLSVTKGGKEYVFYSLETTNYEDNMFLESALEWLRDDLTTVTTANPNAYVYLTCHGLVQGSDVYGTDPDFAYTDWGSTHVGVITGTTAEGKATSNDLYGVLKDFPQVVHFSGHTHFTNVLESTIMSNTYTAISVAAMNEGQPGSGSDPYLDARDASDHGYAMLVEVDTEGRQRITRLEIDDTKLVQATVTYTTDEEDTNGDAYDYGVSDVAASISFPESSSVTPTTLEPWVMDVPNAEGTHLITYSQAARAKNPTFANNASLELTDIVTGADGALSFTATFPTASCENYIIRYELTLYDHAGNELDKSWMYGNWTKSHRGEAEGLIREYDFSYTKEELSGVAGIYATLVAIDEFGGTSEPLMFGDVNDVYELKPIIMKDGFEDGMNNWHDYDSESIDVSDAIAQTGEHSLSITKPAGTTSYVRTEVEAISAETEYTLTYAINTGASAAVKAVVYEYSFNNKIVGKHEAAVYGPSAESEWKQGLLTFTTSTLADKLGIVLVTDGGAGTVYIDNVLLVANEEEAARVHYDDYNGNGKINVADLVRMKRVHDQETEVVLAVDRYADRDGNGTFESADIAGFRKKLAGVANEFAGVIATGDVTGAKLESDAWAYLTTGKAYTNQTFVVKTAIHDTDGEKPFTIGMRIGEATSSPDEAKGLKAAIQNDKIIFSSDAWNDTITKDFALAEGETYVISAKVSDNDGATKTVTIVARQDSRIVASAECVLDAIHAAAIPANGLFVVWSANGTQDVLYQTVQDAAEGAVIVPENASDGVALVTDPDANNKKEGNEGYLFVEGEYTSEVFEFTTKFETNNYLLAGLHQAEKSTAWTKDGVTMILYNWGVAIRAYAGGFKESPLSSQYTSPSGERVNLVAGTVYTFKVWMQGNDLHVVVMQGDTVYGSGMVSLSGVGNQGSASGTAYSIPASGGFAVWKPFGYPTDMEVAYKMPYEDSSSVHVSNVAGERLLTTNKADDKAQSAYMTLSNAYVAKLLEVTTMLADSEKANLQLGVRMVGVTNNPNAKDGLVVQVEKDHFAVYQNGTQIGENIAWDSALSVRKAYTFRVGVIDNTLVVRVLENGVMLCDKSVDVSAATIPASGYLAVWSQDAYREFDYQVVSGGEYAVTLSTPAEGGKVWLTNTNLNDTNCGARLHITGNYTTDTFSATMVANEVNRSASEHDTPNLILGTRMVGNHPNYRAAQGVLVHCYTNSFDIYLTPTTGAVSWNKLGTYSYAAPAGGSYTLVNGEEYTFELSIDFDNKLVLIVKQGETILASNEYTFATDVTIPDVGGFCVWSRPEDRMVSYDILEGEKAETVSEVVESTETAGTAELKTAIAGDLSDASYLAMKGAYTNEVFTFKTTISDPQDPRLIIGAHVREIGNSLFDAEGVLIAVNNVYYTAYTPKWDGACNQGSANYNVSGCPFEKNKEYTFEVQIDEGVLYFTVKDGNTELAYATYDLPDTAPKSGHFMVWSTQAKRNISYEMPKELETVGGNNFAVSTGAEKCNITKKSYMATSDNTYTTETFEVTATMTDDYDSAIVIGSRMQTDNISSFTAGNGVKVVLFKNYYAVYAPTWGGSNSSTSWYAADSPITLSGTYTFSVKVVTSEAGSTCYFTVKQKGKVIWSKEHDVGTSIPTSGNFVVWNDNSSDWIVRYQIKE